MTRGTTAHRHTKAEASSRIAPEIARQAKKYGLSCKRSSDRWSATGKGVKVAVAVAERKVKVEVAAAWYVPVAEGRVLEKIQAALRRVLSA